MTNGEEKMKIINFSYKENKRNYILNKKVNKRINVFLILIIFIVISIFPMTKVEAGDVSKTYTQKVTNGIESFPESYQKLLKQFVEDTFHDNWNFQAYYTGIDWNEFISGERVHTEIGNRVHYSLDTAYRCDCNNLASSYYCANTEITSYFIDPRNFINERNLFQFLEISNNAEIYNKELIGKLVEQYAVFNYGKNITFIMSDENHPKYNQEVTMTYTDIILEAAEISRMSPISMIIKIVQEVGAEGGAITSGTHAQYPNTYNFFNIGAADSGDAVLNGLIYANNHGWHCPYTSIVEGAEFNSEYYIKAGQNTAYFYKYDCVGTKILKAGETQTISSGDLYHRYMTNVQDPYSQSASLFTTYLNNDLLDKNLNFIIPVFENMPEKPIEKISSLSNSDKELYYADISSSLYVREQPTIASKDIMTIYKDDLVVMLQRNHSTSGGNSWDKVQLWDGRIGYTMSKYLEPYVPKTNNETGNTNTGNENTNIGTGGEDSGNTNTGGENSGNNTPIDMAPLIHIGYGYADVSSTLNVRKGPGSSYTVQDSLYPKQEFIILEETSNWYKIKYDNKIGYVSKDYAKKVENIKIDETKKQITLIPNITADIVAGKLSGKAYTVRKGETVISNNTLGTGYVIKVDDKEYTVVKAGDVNGDGKVNTLDALEALKQDVSLIQLKDFNLIAMDVNKDGKYNTIDALDLLKYDVGLTTIAI